MMGILFKNDYDLPYQYWYNYFLFLLLYTQTQLLSYALLEIKNTREDEQYTTS